MEEQSSHHRQRCHFFLGQSPIQAQETQSLSLASLSLSEPQTAATSDQQHAQNYVVSPRSQPTNSIWINPNNKRSKETILTMAYQPDARLVRLTGLASSLDNAEPSEQAVSTILSSQNFPISEADAVLVINNMSCAENAVFALRWFLASIQFSKEVVLLKVLRKAKNWALIESLWELMLRSGVKPDHITFTTIISCAL